jgi:hypothetical protein
LVMHSAKQTRCENRQQNVCQKDVKLSYRPTSFARRHQVRQSATPTF